MTLQTYGDYSPPTNKIDELHKYPMNYTLDAVDSYKSVLQNNNSADNQAVRDKANFVYIVSRMCARCGMGITQPPHVP